MSDETIPVDADYTDEEITEQQAFMRGLQCGVDSVTLAQKLETLKASIVPTFTSRDEASILTLRNRIDAMNKVVIEIRQVFDVMCDNVNGGTFGEDFVTEVTRLRKASTGGGRKATKPKPISALNF